jgi:transcriptional regulator with XRE-family HTH domain
LGMHSDSIGERLKQARILAHLTIPEVSLKTGISKGNLSRLENDINKPSSEALISLSELYHLSVDWILKGEAPKSPYFQESNEEVLKVPDRKLRILLQEIVQLWSESNADVRGWIIIQLKRAFPEVAEKLKNDDQI